MSNGPKGLDRIDDLVMELRRLNLQLVRDQIAINATEDPLALVKLAYVQAGKACVEAAFALSSLQAIIAYEKQRSSEHHGAVAAGNNG